MLQPTFFYLFNKKYPIRAGGVLFYKKIENIINILVIKRNDREYYEDIGGKTEYNDKDYFQTVIREVLEETNNVMKYDTLIEQINKSINFYIKNSKYVLFLIEASDEQINLKKEDFLDIEIYNNSLRIIDWINIDDYINNTKKFHPRLNNDLKNNILSYI